ncbi:PilZ domain-containing protein [Bdellovibrio sp. HCB2-146]|uniref:PilZ domain-containing protein n=1 Tax=Bdellovibrio sp. HCB2-146 TaxID=3394362 RepID=UPI0039BCB90D
MKHSNRVIALIIAILPIYDLYLGHEYGQSIFTPLEWTLIVGSALSLQIRHKSAWMMGLLLMSIFVLKMAKERFFPVIQDEAEPMVRAAKFLGAMIGLFVIGTVGLLFRYPYLDRRQKWLGPTADRYMVQLPVTINGSISAETVDLSYTGAHIRLKNESENIQGGDRISLQIPEISDLVCQAQVIAREKDSLRVNFDNVEGSNKDILRQWLLSQDVPKKA